MQGVLIFVFYFLVNNEVYEFISIRLRIYPAIITSPSANKYYNTGYSLHTYSGYMLIAYNFSRRVRCETSFEESQGYGRPVVSCPYPQGALAVRIHMWSLRKRTRRSIALELRQRQPHTFTGIR